MASPKVKFKRSAVASKRPSLASLELGELALNTYDGKLFVRRDTSGVGIATTISTVNPWTENYGSSGISYGGNISVTGVSTFSSNIDLNASIDVSGNITGSGDLTLTDTDEGSSAGPELKLYRNSSSPADADYLGQIKFAGESDTGVERNYAKITGKILDASNGTEDGVIEFAHIKAGSQNISARFRSDSLQLLNGTSLTVNGSSTFTGNILANSDSTVDIGTNSTRFANGYFDTLYGDGSNLTGVGGASSISDLSDATTNSNGSTIGLGVSALANDDGTDNGNTALGYQAGLDITSGSTNVLLGNTAGRDVTTANGTIAIGDVLNNSAGVTGNYNIAISGFWAGRDLTSGNNNVFIGSRCGENITSGTSNVILGDNAGRIGTVNASCVFIGNNAGQGQRASYVVAIGYEAGMNVINAGNDHNIYIGSSSGKSAGQHEYDIMIGYKSGYDVTNDSGYNVLIGYNAGYYAASESNVCIGRDAGNSGDSSLTLSGGNCTLIGKSAGTTLGSGSNVTCIGNSAEPSSATASNEITLGNTGITTFRIPGIGITFGDNSSPTDGHVLTYSSSTGLVTLAAASGGGISNVVEDTTPQLGGTLDTNGNLIQFGDSDPSSGENENRLKFGASQDMEIYHNKTKNIIETAGNQNLQLYSLGTGAVEIASDAPKLIFNDVTGGNQIDFSINANTGVFTMEDDSNSDTFFKYTQNGAVELYHNNSKKLETTTNGVTITGRVDPAADSTHDLGTTSVRWRNVYADTLYGDGSNLTGISGGISNLVEDTTPQLGGTLDTNGNLIQFGDSSGTTDDRLQFGASQDLSIYHNGSDSYVSQGGNGNLFVRNTTDDADVVIKSDNGSGGTADYFRADGSTGEVILYHYGTQKLATKSTGIDVTGLTDTDTLNVSGGSTFNDTVHLPADVQLRFDSNNTTDSLRIYDDGSNSRFISDHSIFFGTNSTWAVLNESQNSYKIRANSTNVLLYHSGNEKFRTTADGAIVTGILTATDFNSTSDARLKTNVQLIDDPLEKVLQINGVSFNWIENNKPSMGVIADNIQEVLPELVTNTNPKTVNYNGLIGLLIEVVKEQQTQINSLKERISRLE